MPGKYSFHLIQIKNVRVGFSTGALASLAKKILREQRNSLPELKKIRTGIIELIWVGEAGIKMMNNEYRGKNKATDVLSFSYLHGMADQEEAESLIGQIVICVPVLRRQAQEHKHSLATEASILFVHGLLHVLGYDHQKKSDLARMKEMEQKYLGDKSGLIARTAPE